MACVLRFKSQQEHGICPKVFKLGNVKGETVIEVTVSVFLIQVSSLILEKDNPTVSETDRTY